MDAKSVITMVISTAVLIISLPILATALVDASTTTGVSTNFVSALDIAQLVLGFAPIGLLIGFLVVKYRNR